MHDGTGPTLDQRRARHAWEAVARIKATGARRTGKDARKEDRQESTLEKSYSREAKRLPVRILTAGLGHALAFLHAKSAAANANDALLRDVADWVLDKRDRPDSTNQRPGPNALMDKIIEQDGTFLQVATDEVLAYLLWLTRFVEAEFGAGED